MARRRRRIEWHRAWAGVMVVAVSATAGGCDMSLAPGSPVTVVDERATGDGIGIVVVLPPGWPSPDHTAPPEVVVSSPGGREHRVVVDGSSVAVRLPVPGAYAISAVAASASCEDTAVYAPAGNPPVEVSDGVIVELLAIPKTCA